jgi:hypothetical protein
MLTLNRNVLARGTSVTNTRVQKVFHQRCERHNARDNDDLPINDPTADGSKMHHGCSRPQTTKKDGYR